MSDIADWFKSLPIFTRWWLGLTAMFSLAGRFGLLKAHNLILLYQPFIHRFQKLNSETRWRAIAEEFCSKWNFPQCLGSVDGKHVQIVAPEHSGSLYFNYKGTFSIVLLGVADANYNFLYADVGCQGRISDGGVFKYTSLYEDLERKRLNVPGEEPLPGRTKSFPFVLVGDDAFALSTYMMKPYAGRTPGASSPERIFNYRLSRARRVIENVFGIMSSKFRVLLYL